MDPRLIFFVIAALVALTLYTSDFVFAAAAAGVSAGYCMSAPSIPEGVVGGKPKSKPSKRLPVVVEEAPNTPTVETTEKSKLRRRHHGQRKLFLSELAALTEVCRRYLGGDATAKIRVLYIGSAPGHHIPTLMECFPSFTWELRDPRTFWNVLEKDKRVNITKGYFKDADADALKGKIDFVISDIRRNKIDMGEAWEQSIWDDMLMQKRWVETIAPKYGSLLKMRLPWCKNPGQVCEPELANATTVEYLDGMNMFQLFAGVNSHETRLLSFPPFGTRSYDFKETEVRTDYFNRIIREKQNYDIRREYELWENYLKLKTPPRFKKMNTNDAKGWFLKRMHEWSKDYSEWAKTVPDTPVYE